MWRQVTLYSIGRDFTCRSGETNSAGNSCWFLASVADPNLAAGAPDVQL